MKFRLLLTLIGVCLVWGVPAAESDEVNEATGEIVSATPASPAPRALTCSLSFPMAVSRGTTPQWTINYPDSVGKPRTENVFFFWPSVVPNTFKELGLGQKQFIRGDRCTLGDKRSRHGLRICHGPEPPGPLRGLRGLPGRSVGHPPHTGWGLGGIRVPTTRSPRARQHPRGGDGGRSGGVECLLA
jgi:hypothetical protein